LTGKAKNLLKKYAFKELEVLFEEMSTFPRSHLINTNTNEDLYIEYQVLIAQYKFIIADYSSSHELFSLALTAKTDLNGPDDVGNVEIMIGIAEGYRAQARYEDAETFLTQVCVKLFLWLRL